MIIISGKLYVPPDHRDDFLEASKDAMVEARRTPGCMDFVVAADPIEPDRVNVYECWESDAALEAFRQEGPEPALAADIRRADVQRHEVIT